MFAGIEPLKTLLRTTSVDLSLEHFMEQEILAAYAGARKEWAKKQGRDLLAIDDQR
jgi:hypothetical protein